MTESLRTDNLTIPQGTTWRVQWPLTDATGAGIDLSTYTARAQVRNRVQDAAALYSWTTEDGTIEMADSTVTLIVSPTVSTAWDWTSGVYDLELVSAAGDVTRLTQGRITVSAEVTR